MLTYGQSTFAIILSIVGALLLVALLNRFWPVEERKISNEVNAWQLGVLGTTYGVILGFMLFTVWTDFHAAGVDVALETTSLINVHRIANGLPSPQREAARHLAIQYAQAVMQQEWPAMQTQRENHAGQAVLQQMWQAATSVQTRTPEQVNSLNHLMTAISNLGERRQMRMEEHESRVPTLLWVLLIVGAIATIVSACLLGNDKRWLHYCQVVALTFVIVVTLAAIADLARPFEGAVAIHPTALERALIMMQPNALP